MKLTEFGNFKIPVLSIEFVYGVVTINDFNRVGILMHAKCEAGTVF
jgi:hypothetical protein